MRYTHSKEAVTNANYSHYDIPPTCSPLWCRSLNSVVAGASLWVSGQGERLRCPECGREMKNEHSLSVHISRYHNDKCAPTQALCPVCHKVYSNQYSLRTHMHLQAAQHNTQHTYQSCVSVSHCFMTESFLVLSVCVAQHKDQLFLLGQKKRGRRPGSASVTSLNKEIFPTSARQQSHYYNAHDNEDLLENRLSSPQDSKNISMLDLSRLQ